MMYRFAFAVALLGAALSTTGCDVVFEPPTPPCPFNQPCDQTNTFVFAEDIQSVPSSTAIANSQQIGKSLFDADAALTYMPNSSELAITVTTDNGQTFSQTFSAAPADASGFSSAAPETITYAFAPQSPQSISAFINSAASKANSTVSVKIQIVAGFAGPSGGSQHTVYGRSYAASYGVQNVGSVTYTAPTSDDGGGGGQVTSIN